ncbi:MAG: hypothetical protein IVW51_09135 [Thermaceae bacterium]|nr:hypothetical protein [Thermaceae bacterium]
MKRALILWIGIVVSAALAQTPVRNQPLPTLQITPVLLVTLYRKAPVVARAAAPQSITLLYRTTQVAQVFTYHHRDLLAHGWAVVSLKEDPKSGRYQASYKKGSSRASLRVVSQAGQVSVTLKQD